MKCAKLSAILLIVMTSIPANNLVAIAKPIVQQPHVAATARSHPAVVASSNNGAPHWTEATGIAAGGGHTCAVTATGGVMCWGWNAAGELGDGTNSPHWIPLTVSGLASGVQAVAAGDDHTCAMLASGGVKCWGANASGQLGDGTTTERRTPVAVTGLTGGVQAIAAGSNHTCALMKTGGVKCWGANGHGQVGDDTLAARTTPVDVVGLSGGIQAIATGDMHSCALKTSGGVKCWGSNEFGQLGDGTKIDRLIPADVAGLVSGIQALGAGYDHTCAVTAAGGVKCWGFNGYGQLGNGATADHLTPVDVIDLNSSVVAVAAGGWHTCALTVPGAVKCWGINFDGELGDGTTTDRSTPADVTGLTGRVNGVSAGRSHACAVAATGDIQCWGDNATGALGDGAAYFRSLPVPAAALNSDVKNVAAGERYTCALTIGGAVKCWGDNRDGQLGDGTRIAHWTPGEVSGLTALVEAIGAGQNHTCALTAAGGVKCWGDNGSGQLGDGTAIDRTMPVDVLGLDSGVQAIAVGGNHTCAIMSTGAVKCWGNNIYGQLGDGTQYNSMAPVDVVALDPVKALAAGGFHTCAVTAGGGARCWGGGSSGQLGDGATVDSRLTPVNVVNLSNGVSMIHTGWASTCAVIETGGAKCWGYNGDGQLGDGTRANRPTPTDVIGLGAGVATVAPGQDHTCALRTTGEAVCWGAGEVGQLGNGRVVDSLTPVAVRGLGSSAQTITSGQSHSCALTSPGGAICWGYSLRGQLGVNPGWTPVEVIFPAPLPNNPGAFFPSIAR